MLRLANAPALIAARVALMVALAIVATPERADACSGDSDTWTVPGGLQLDVPPNLTAIYVADHFDQIRLEDETGVPVAVGAPTAEPDYGTTPLRRVPLAEPLAPDRTYWIVTQRGGLSARVDAFTTGSVPDETAPSAVSIEGLDLGYALVAPGTDSSCSSKFLTVKGTLAGFGPSDVIAVRVVGPDTDETRVLPASTRALESLGRGDYAPQLNVAPCTDYQLSIWARDVVGRDGPVTAYDAHVRGCPAIRETDHPDDCFVDSGPDVCPGDPVFENGIEEEADGDGGCSTGPAGRSASLLVALALLFVRKRRR